MKIERPIAQLREKAGLTQVELAESIGVSENTIANWEKGGASKWIRQLHKLCLTLNCTLQDLDPDLQLETPSCPVTLTETNIESVKSYCIAREKGEKRTENKIASYAALHDKQLQYWLDQAKKLIVDVQDNEKQGISVEIVVNTLRLENLVTQLSCSPPEEVDYERFCNLVREVKLDPEFIEHYLDINFKDKDDFRRVLILQKWSLTVYVIEWQPEQSSGVHHHGNSLDAIYVLEGEMTHHLITPEECQKAKVPYEHYPEEQKIEKGAGEIIKKGNFIFINRRYGHNIANLSGKRLITLHFRFGVAPDDERWLEHPREKTHNRRVFRWEHTEQCKFSLPQ